MKKTLAAIAAIAAIAASCSKSEVAYEATGEIGFIPVTENMTKTMMTGSTFQTSENFNLWAYYKPVAASTSAEDWLSDVSDHQIYINEKPFTHREGTSWGGVTPYFWPKTGSLVFVGYYPTTIENNVEHDLTTNTMTFSNIPQSRVAESGYDEDIMYFNLTPSYATNSVAAEFKHALSWISVLLVKSDTTPDDATITVNKVEFTNVLPSGDATVVGSNDIAWTPKGTAATVEILEGTDVELAKNNTTVQAYEPLFIPQTMAGNLVVTYTISSTDESEFQEVHTTKLSDMTDSESNELEAWEAGKHYTYTITIGTEEILVAPTVKEWDEVEIDLPIQ